MGEVVVEAVANRFAFLDLTYHLVVVLVREGEGKRGRGEMEDRRWEMGDGMERRERGGRIHTVQKRFGMCPTIEDHTSSDVEAALHFLLTTYKKEKRKKEINKIDICN